LPRLAPPKRKFQPRFFDAYSLHAYQSEKELMRRTFLLVVATLAIASPWMAGCNRATSSYTKVEPAKVEHTAGSEISKVTLSEKAMERIGVKTTPLLEGKVEGAQNDAPRPFVPYSAIMYVPNGNAYVYTSPSPRTFVRHPVGVDYIERGVAVLKTGPKPGTEVVTEGAAELFGAEFGVGH
jgi:hypothetical protein